MFSRVLLAVTVPPALPGFGCIEVCCSSCGNVWSDGTDQAAAAWTCLAMAQTKVIGTFKEKGSGVKLDRAERRKVIALAQARHIDAVLVTELSR